MANREKIEKLDELISDSISGKVIEQTVASLLPRGENYGSVMYRVDFKVQKDDKVDEYHAVAKCPPLNKVTQEIFNTQVSFKAEIAWYTTVVPTFKEFQRNQGMKKEVDFFQKYYGSRISLDPNSEKVDLEGVILTQNLKYLGYKNIDRHIGFDLRTSYSVLRDLATLHAVPLAIKRFNPDVYEKNIRPCLCAFNKFDDKIAEDMNQGLLEIFEQIPETEHLKKRIEKSINEAVVFQERPTRYPWDTVIHMDVWLNNIMVTEEENPKTVILDFQTPVPGSPAADLIFFLLTSVNLAVIQEHYDSLVKVYYEQLINNLEQLQVPTEDFTYEGLVNEIAIETRAGEFSHALGHNNGILGEKGHSAFDSADENFKLDDFSKNKVIPTERHIEKFKWIALEAEKRNWI